MSIYIPVTVPGQPYSKAVDPCRTQSWELRELVVELELTQSLALHFRRTSVLSEAGEYHG